MRIDPGSVSLAPMTEEDVRRLEEGLATPEGTGEFQWFGFTSSRRFSAKFVQDGLLGPDGGMFAVRVDGSAVGRVEWFSSSWGRPTSSCWTVAAGIDASRRGQGIGSLAQRLLVEYLFAGTRAERIQAYTDVDNRAERRALEQAGFEEEGVLRRAQWRDGAWHDLVLFSTLRR
ncbi:GNAT family N-acetyltransferase [Rathayibacter rathayi]|uniref:GNAT family N-acetyltransferase n=1 Tax=Rathayibacter rathayi TaxID=33887 RepID=UPI000CE72CE5|nr:GNAT family protein [Rathayibacter rathayi]PPF23907.1 N-acetyltransferase [Rathayibacter rathayi]PPG95190.1 N-acetyltransferase [Rathayibacter rathayi]